MIAQVCVTDEVICGADLSTKSSGDAVVGVTRVG